MIRTTTLFVSAIQHHLGCRFSGINILPYLFNAKSLQENIYDSLRILCLTIMSMVMEEGAFVD